VVFVSNFEKRGEVLTSTCSGLDVIGLHRGGVAKKKRLMLDLCQYSVDRLIEDGVNFAQGLRKVTLIFRCGLNLPRPYMRGSS
jgi:hypothetical protein